MHLTIGFLSLPCKDFIGTLNALFNTCVYTVQYIVYTVHIQFILVVEYCMWVCFL